MTLHLTFLGAELEEPPATAKFKRFNERENRRHRPEQS